MRLGLALLGFSALGVVGYVVYKKAQAAALPPPVLPGTLTPLPQVTVPAAAPAAVTPTPSAPSALQTAFENPPRLLPDPFRVTTGQRYRFRYQKGALDLSSVSGFSDVKLYDQVEQLPNDWPASMASADSSLTGWGSATWSGAGGDLQKPFGMYQVWPTMAAT